MDNYQKESLTKVDFSNNAWITAIIYILTQKHNIKLDKDKFLFETNCLEQEFQIVSNFFIILYINENSKH